MTFFSKGFLIEDDKFDCDDFIDSLEVADDPIRGLFHSNLLSSLIPP
jgi:hypothetical protein